MTVIRVFQSRAWLLGLALAVGAGHTTFAAETYRWRDAEGGVHFGDKPPPDVAAERLNIRTQPSTLTPDEARAEVERLRAVEAGRQQAEAAERSRAGAEASRAADEHLARQQRCEEAKWALAALESGRPVYRDEQNMFRIKRQPVHGDAYEGKREYLDEDARQQEIANQQRLVAENCEAPLTAEDKARTEEEILHAEYCEKAAADLEVLSRPESGASPEEIAARRALLESECGR